MTGRHIINNNIKKESEKTLCIMKQNKQISFKYLKHNTIRSSHQPVKYKDLYSPTINFIIFVNTPFNESPKEQPRTAWLTSVLSFWSKNTKRITAVGVRKTRGWKEKPSYFTAWTNHNDQLIPNLCTVYYAVRSMLHSRNTCTLKTIYFTYFHSIMEYGTILAGNAPYSTQIFTL